MPAYRQPSVTRLFERHKAPWARDGVAAPDDAVLQLCDHHDDLFERPVCPSSSSSGGKSPSWSPNSVAGDTDQAHAITRMLDELQAINGRWVR
jgi:hypothetical protein